MTRRETNLGRMLYPERHRRPERRQECYEIPRPCPFVSCEYNLYLDVNEETGSIKFNFPDIEPLEMKKSCVLDISEQGEQILEVVGNIMNMTKERIRQIEESCLKKLSLTSLFDELFN